MSDVGLEVGAVGLQVYATPHPDPDLDPEPAALTLVAKARTSIVMSAYAFTLAPLAAALVAAKGRGVAVTVVQDATEYAAAGSQGPALLAAGIDLRVWGGAYNLNHEKVLVVDGAVCWTGSYNWSTTAERANREVATVVTGAKVRAVLAPLLTAQIMATYAAGAIPASTSRSLP